MGRMNLGVDDEITFKEDTHQYFNRDGKEYKSVSKAYKSVQTPFNREFISRNMARGIAAETGGDINLIQAELLGEWDGKRDGSSTHGKIIHGGMEDYVRKGIIDPNLKNAIETLKLIIAGAYRLYPEVILYSHEYEHAGTADLVVQRQKSQNSIYDFFDYKTNKEKGILFDSIGRKNNVIKHYNKMLLPPLAHLEDCNYILYSLQLSLYALFAELTYGITVGRLAILFIDCNYNLSYIPTVYMKTEAIAIMQHQKTMKPLPPVIHEKQNVFDVNNISEDW